MNLDGIFFIYGIVSMTLFIILLLLVQFAVGLKSVWIYGKAKYKKRKGYGLIRILHKTGVEQLMTVKYEDTMELDGKDKGKYIFKAHCIGTGPFGLPVISYRQGDADPIDPRTGLQTTTSTKVLENLIARSVKAEIMAGHSPVEEWLKKNWMMLLIAGGVLVGAFVFIIMQQNDTIAQLGMKSGQIVINASQIGK